MPADRVKWGRGRAGGRPRCWRPSMSRPEIASCRRGSRCTSASGAYPGHRLSGSAPCVPPAARRRLCGLRSGLPRPSSNPPLVRWCRGAGGPSVGRNSRFAEAKGTRWARRDGDRARGHDHRVPSNAMFRVELDNGHEVLAHIRERCGCTTSGSFRTIVSSWSGLHDLTRGRIVYRYK